MKKVLYLLTFFAVSFASAQDFSGVISSYLNSNHTQLGLQSQDVEEFSISSQSYSNSMKLDNVYVNQLHSGIEVYNSNSSFAIKNGTVTNTAISFTEGVTQKVNTTQPVITASSAISSAASALGIQNPGVFVLLETTGNNSFIFSDGNISLENIPVRLVYQTTENNTLRLAWDLSIYLLDASHYYSVRVDAVNGALLDTADWVTSCSFGEVAHSHSNSSEEQSVLFSNMPALSVGFMSEPEYRVFAIPAESPNHAPDAIVLSPADATASPFGWHDTDGLPGAESTLTIGNNVTSQDDINGNNGTGFSPDGGADLHFDFPFDLTMQPNTYLDGSLTNLFYMNNILHDVLYHYGFDEASGNFQENNYGNGGLGSDSVNADGQDGSGTNNANFATPPDGSNPRMQMFLWSPAPADLLTINTGPLTGSYLAIEAAFGGPLTTTPVTADTVVVMDDDSGPSTDPNDACDPITNGPDLAGKIVFIRRGMCEFGFKVLAAETEGAIAVVMVNNVAGAPIIMGAGSQGGSVTIPSVMVSNVDGEAMIAEIMGGGPFNATLVLPTTVGPDIDGDLDNGIVAHEFGHGVSNRLTGGPANTGCLNNTEQMGEGWSDYLSLMFTIEPGDMGTDARGIGTYALGQPTTGGGIRTFPYSTDMTINPHTYDDIKTEAVPHGVGSVWCEMLWEMTWDLIDANGGTIGDIYTGTSGNNIALQLVMDGMKLQPCSPGFVDGRDAILAADLAANGGANECLIWRAFARRGLGVSALQGSSGSVLDGTEAFDVPVGCDLGVNDNGASNNFIIYPNPSNGNINIRSTVEVGNATISIMDINGRVVYSQEAEMNNTVNISAENLTSGIYMIQIKSADYNQTSKLIIQ
jgi:hypothetical protein